MTQIAPHIITYAKLLLARLKPPDDIEEHEALSTLIAIGEKLAAGTHVVASVEPTEEMSEAGLMTIPGTLGVCLADVEDVYRTMIAAIDPPNPSEKKPYLMPEWDELAKIHNTYQAKSGDWIMDITGSGYVICKGPFNALRQLLQHQ